MNKSQMLSRSLEHDDAVFQLIGLSISFLRRGKISLISVTGALPLSKVLRIHPGAQNKTSDLVTLSQLA